MKKIIIFTAFMMSVYSVCFSAPVINSVSGTVSKGNTLTIIADDITAKTTAAPTKWDNFESGSDGSQVTGWTLPNSTDKPDYTNTLQRTGSTLCSYSATGGSDMQHIEGGTLSKGYITFWAQAEQPDPSPSDQNNKFFRVHRNNSTPINPVLSIVTLGNPQYITSNVRDEDYVYFQSSSNMANPGLVWQRYEFIWEESNAPGGTFDGTADGTLIFGSQQGGEGNVFTYGINQLGNTITNNSGGTNHFEVVSFTEYNRHNNTPFRLDDIYIDLSWNRAEIGDNAVFENCTHREIQIPILWEKTVTDENSEVQITVNQGSFSAETGAYLFLIDDTNTASVGHPITFATSTAPTNVITTEDGQTVSNPSFTIQGTATATAGRTITGIVIPDETVTCDDGTCDELEEAWTCNITLSEGANSYTATATDSSAETGFDTIGVTYTIPVSSGVTTILNTGTPVTRLNTGTVQTITN